MKSLVLSVVMVLSASASLASYGKAIACTEKSRLEMIQLIASSEALAMRAGPRRDVSIIEIFALAKDGLQAGVNITFHGTNGDSEAANLNASINCEAGGILELND